MTTITQPLNVEAPSTQKREHLEFVDGFRALAIVLVIAGHCWFLTSARPWEEPAIGWIGNIINGGTSLFVFISGLLFHHLYCRKWDFSKFLSVKAKNLFLPYAVMTAVALLVFSEANFSPITYLYSMASGNAGYSLWYLPFVAIIFAASPLFIRYMQAQMPTRLACLMTAFILGILVHRPEYNVDKLQAAVYFSFYYLLGIEASINGAFFKRALSQRNIVFGLFILLIFLSIIEAQHMGYKGSYGSWFEPLPLNIRYMANIVLILLCCGLCMQFPSLNQGHMKELAIDSFGIFFIHNFVVMALSPSLGKISVTGSYLLDVTLCVPLVLFSSWALVRLLKRVLGRYSKNIIGA